MDSQPDGEGVEDFIAKYVVIIEKEATVKDAASLMASRKCSCLVVLQGDAAVGIVTERDLVRKILAAGVSHDGAARDSARDERRRVAGE